MCPWLLPLYRVGLSGGDASVWPTSLDIYYLVLYRKGLLTPV